MKTIEIEIKELFDIIELLEGNKFEDNIEYFQDEIIFIQNENDEWVKVVGMITKTDKIRKLTFDSGDVTEVANKHLISINNTICEEAANLKVGDSIKKSDKSDIKLISNEIFPEERVYDIEVDSDNHLYKTSNGIIHHNTQLFRILSGLIKPHTGSVRVGLDLHPIQVGEVAVVPQNYLLFNHRTIFTNLKIGLTGSGAKFSDKDIKDIINSYADKFGLTDHLKKYPMELSGGQRQRVSIIQQILTGNEFILLDEPFSGLDSVVKESILQLLVTISNLDELKTLIIISHDIENSLAISDTALVLANEEGKKGSTITNTFDLANMGLAWDPKIKENEEFKKLVSHIKTII